MSIFTEPTVRFEPADDESSPIEARLQTDGRIRFRCDPDSFNMSTTWLTPAEVREFCTELLGLADASEKIHYVRPGQF